MEVKIHNSNGLSGVEITTDARTTSLNYGIRPQYSDLTTTLEITTDKNLLFHSTCRCTVNTPVACNFKEELRKKGNVIKTLK